MTMHIVLHFALLIPDTACMIHTVISPRVCECVCVCVCVLMGHRNSVSGLACSSIPTELPQWTNEVAAPHTLTCPCDDS